MKVLILLVLTVVTSQAQQWPLNRRQVTRQGDQELDRPMNDQLYEKLKKLAKKYMIDDSGDPNILALLIPDMFKSGNLRSRELDKRPPNNGYNMNEQWRNSVVNPASYNQYQASYNPVPSRFGYAVQDQNSNYSPRFTTVSGVHSRFSESESNQRQQVSQVNQDGQRLQQTQAEREARLAHIDREVLSNLPDEDRKILESKLSQTQRQALLARLEDGQLDDILPREENRFGGFGTSISGFSGAVAQIGATAGGYIGGKLAGTLGAKLGAAAGAYLGAAAASRFIKKSADTPEVVEPEIATNNVPDDKTQNPPFSVKNYGSSYGHFGAVVVNNHNQ